MTKGGLWTERVSDWANLPGSADDYAPLLLISGVWGVDHLVSVVAGVDPITPVSIVTSLLELAGLLLVVSTITVIADNYRTAAGDVSAYSSVPAVDEQKVGLLERFLRTLDGVWLLAVAKLDGKWSVTLAPNLFGFPLRRFTLFERVFGMLQQFWKWLLRTRGDDWTMRLAPRLLRPILWSIGVLFHVFYLFGLENHGQVLATYGPIYGPFSFYFVIPVLYYPILAELVAVIIGVCVTLPARIRTERLLDFEDPLGYGGLRDVGRVIEISARRYTIALVIYALLTVTRGYQMEAFRGNLSAIYVDIFYLFVATGVGFLLFGYPLVALHSFMTLQKERYLESVAANAPRNDESGQDFSHNEAPKIESKLTRIHRRVNLHSIRDMHVYPVTGLRIIIFPLELALPLLLQYAITEVL